MGRVLSFEKLHHLSVDLLRTSYFELQRKAAPGVNVMRWREYGDGPDNGPPQRGFTGDDVGVAGRSNPAIRNEAEVPTGHSSQPLGACATIDHPWIAECRELTYIAPFDTSFWARHFVRVSKSTGPRFALAVRFSQACRDLAFTQKCV